MTNGPTDYEDYFRRMDWNRVQEWVHRHSYEQPEEEEDVEEPEEAEADVEGSEN